VRFRRLGFADDGDTANRYSWKRCSPRGPHTRTADIRTAPRHDCDSLIGIFLDEFANLLLRFLLMLAERYLENAVVDVLFSSVVSSRLSCFLSE
jgi:hypothetical protein